MSPKQNQHEWKWDNRFRGLGYLVATLREMNREPDHEQLCQEAELQDELAAGRICTIF